MAIAKQRFNHVAMSVPRDLLDEEGRADLLRFYGEVFGWTEMPTLTKDRELFVLRAHRNDQFVFLVGSDEPTRCTEGDHLGLSVPEVADLESMLLQARRWAEREPRVRFEDRTIEDYQVLKLHAFYVGYRLPMKVEVQCYEWAEGLGPESLPGPD